MIVHVVGSKMPTREPEAELVRVYDADKTLLLTLHPYAGGVKAEFGSKHLKVEVGEGGMRVIA